MFQDRLKRAGTAATRRGNRKADEEKKPIDKFNSNSSKPINASPPTEQEKLKLLFETCADRLIGREVYNLFEETQRPGTSANTRVSTAATTTTTTNSTSTGKAATAVVETSTLDPYTKSLLDYSCDADIEIDNRVVRTPGKKILLLQLSIGSNLTSLLNCEIRIGRVSPSCSSPTAGTRCVC